MNLGICIEILNLETFASEEVSRKVLTDPAAT
jgi:hypothetical protein